MLAGGMDALAAPVGERGDAIAADELGKPAGKIAGHQIAGLGRQHPAPDQRHGAEGCARASVARTASS